MQTSSSLEHQAWTASAALPSSPTVLPSGTIAFGVDAAGVSAAAGASSAGWAAFLSSASSLSSPFVTNFTCALKLSVVSSTSLDMGAGLCQNARTGNVHAVAHLTMPFLSMRNVTRAVSANPRRPLPTWYALRASPSASLKTGY